MKGTYDKWESVLIALYASALSGHGFNDVNAVSMGMQKGAFGWTLYILQMRGMIEGCKFQPPKQGEPDDRIGVARGALLLTPKGFEKAEEMLTEQSDSARLTEARSILANIGCGIMANIISRFMGL